MDTAALQQAAFASFDGAARILGVDTAELIQAIDAQALARLILDSEPEIRAEPFWTEVGQWVSKFFRAAD